MKKNPCFFVFRYWGYHLRHFRKGMEEAKNFI